LQKLIALGPNDRKLPLEFGNRPTRASLFRSSVMA
jgi:hypothetical protein